MKGNLVKKIIGILLTSVIFMYLSAGISSADTTQIDLGSLETIGEDTTTTTTTTTKTSPTKNVIPEVDNKTVANTKTLPQTGSNNEIIFVAGLTILIGTAIYVYKQQKYLNF